MKETITHDEFSCLDIRIGEIVSAEAIEGADKLLKLLVNVGDERRTIVSGIREYVDDVEQLIGKKVPFILNLEPRVLRGVESQGMLIAVKNKEGFCFLSPEGESEAGDIVI